MGRRFGPGKMFLLAIVPIAFSVWTLIEDYYYTGAGRGSAAARCVIDADLPVAIAFTACWLLTSFILGFWQSREIEISAGDWGCIFAFIQFALWIVLMVITTVIYRLLTGSRF